MIDVHAESTYKAADAMAERGGSFVKELGAAWYCADPINKQKLVTAFEHYFIQYGAVQEATLIMPPCLGWIRFGRRSNEIQVMIEAVDDMKVPKYAAINFPVSDLLNDREWRQIGFSIQTLIVESLKVIGEWPPKKND